MKKQTILSRLKLMCVLSGAVLLIGLAVSCKKNEPLAAAAGKSTDVKKRTTAIPTLNEALVAMQVYNNNFYNQYGTYGPSYKAYYWKDQNHTNRMDFWMQAEAIEMFIDAYDANPSQDFKDKIHYLYNGMRDGYGVTWENNEFNDDIIWGALMCVRAYAITNDGGMLDMAKNNFDIVWNRAWDTQLGGGLWWKTDKQSKNVCVNAPAVICAMKIYQATGNADYKTKAKMIMDWMVNKFYVSTGEVKGAVNAADVITEGTRTYTQGTFIGACDVLRNEYPAVNYTTMANNTMNYTKNNMCNAAGILPDEYDTGDTQGFKGIFARWACIYVASANLQSTYGQWLDDNATAAWGVRNSSGVMWGKWGIRTPDNQVLSSFETHNGVSMLNNVYRYH